MNQKCIWEKCILRFVEGEETHVWPKDREQSYKNNQLVTS